MKPFNSDTAIEELVKELNKDFSFDTFIETGTYYGATSKWFAETFPEKEVHTIENHFENYQHALKTLAHTPNIYSHYGDSIDLIKEVASIFPITKPFFYLDAHWYMKWPLLQELEVISTLYKDNCCIMIDDFQTPNRPSHQFDKYDGKPNNLDYVLSSLQKVFTDPFIFFVDKSNRQPRPVGKLLCIPMAWKSSLTIPLKEEKEYLYY